MEDNNKYYTPEIEEFHVGFEYEESYERWTGSVAHFGDFEKSVFEFHEGEFSDCDALQLIKWKLPERVRVKYLDKQDIEELGWINRDSLPDDLVFEIKNFKLILRNVGDVRFPIKISFQECLIFVGNIKNKSELKKLMKMLQIM